MWTDFEKHMLSLAIPSVGLGACESFDDEALQAKAEILGYGDPDFCKRGEGNLRALFMVLGVLPSSFEERMAVVGG